MTLTRTFLLPFTTAAMLLVPLSSDTPAFFADESSLQLQVTPRETEVFVDGYFAGKVDAFDGRFQRLHIQPGEHELTLYLDGHRTIKQTIRVRPRSSFRIRYEMTPLAAGEAPVVRPSRPPRPPAPPDAPAAESDAARVDGYGAVSIRVQPADAEVLIDGKRWENGTEKPLVVELSAGVHSVEVRKDGYRGYTAQVDVRGKETSSINVSLSKGEGR